MFFALLTLVGTWFTLSILLHNKHMPHTSGGKSADISKMLKRNGVLAKIIPAEKSFDWFQQKCTLINWFLHFKHQQFHFSKRNSAVKQVSVSSRLATSRTQEFQDILCSVCQKPSREQQILSQNFHKNLTDLRKQSYTFRISKLS